MQLLQDIPIGRKVLMITMLTSSVALLLVCVSFLFYEQAAFRRTLARDFSIIADMFDDAATPGLVFSDPTSVEQVLNSLGAHPRIMAACVYDKTGQIVANYKRKDCRDYPLPAAERTHSRFLSDRLETFRDIILNDEFIGTVYIGSDLSELRERLWHYTNVFAVLLAICSMATLLFASRLQKVISEPIVELARTTAAVATEKNYALRVVKRGEDEIGGLIDGFNHMLSQIQQRDAELETARDNLERRVEERTGELAHSLSLLNATLDSTADGILAADNAGRIVCYNAKFAAMWGLPPEVLERRERGEYVAFAAQKTADPDQFMRRVAELRMAPETETFDVLELKDGRTFERYLQPQRMDGKCIGTVLNFRDVTERKKAELELRASEEKFRQLAENISAVFWMTSANMRKFIYVSPAYKNVWGDDAETLYQKPAAWEQSILLEDRPRVLQARRRLVLEQQNYSVEYRIVRPDQSIRWIQDSGFQIRDKEGRANRIAGIAADITERKHTELAMDELHKQLLEASRKAGMSEVATSVLHNVGNVLNSVNVSAEIVIERVREFRTSGLQQVAALLREHADDLPAFLTRDPRGQALPDYLLKLADHLASPQKAILQEAEGLKKNIEHIKDIVARQQSYARSGGVVESLAAVELIEDAIRINLAGFSRHGVRLIREYAETPELVTDRHKVVQILVNLMSNAKYALEAVNEEKKLIVQLTPRNASGVRIAVIDNGAGIAPENLTRIFQHGFTTRKDGHGFGLHSGALAARELGGTLTVNSDGLGKGAAFTLDLPLQNKESRL